MERLKEIRAMRERQDKAMALFIRTLKKQPEVLDTWNDTIWTVMVEKVLVHKHGGLTFQFYNGSAIRPVTSFREQKNSEKPSAKV